MAGLWTASLFLLTVLTCDAVFVDQQETVRDNGFAATSGHTYGGVLGTSRTEEPSGNNSNNRPQSRKRVDKHMRDIALVQKAKLGKSRRVIERRRKAFKKIPQKRRIPTLVAQKWHKARQQNAQHTTKLSLGKKQLTADEEDLEKEEASDEDMEEDNNPSKPQLATVEDRRKRILADLVPPASHSALASAPVAGSISTAATTPLATSPAVPLVASTAANTPGGATPPTALQIVPRAVADLAKLSVPEGIQPVPIAPSSSSMYPQAVWTVASAPPNAAIAPQAVPPVATASPSSVAIVGPGSPGSSIAPQATPSVAISGVVPPGPSAVPQVVPSVATTIGVASTGSSVATQAAPSVATVGPVSPGSSIVPVSPVSPGSNAIQGVPSVGIADVASPVSSIAPQVVPSGAMSVPSVLPTAPQAVPSVAIAVATSPSSTIPSQTGSSVATTVPAFAAAAPVAAKPAEKLYDTVSDLMDKFQDRKRGIHESIAALTHAENWMARVSGVLQASGILSQAEAANSNSEEVEAKLKENTKKLSKLIDSSLGYIKKADARVLKAEKQAEATEEMSAAAANESKGPAAAAAEAAKMVKEAAEDAASGAVPAAMSFVPPTTALTGVRVSRPTVSTMADEISAIVGKFEEPRKKGIQKKGTAKVGAEDDLKAEDALFTEQDEALMDPEDAEAASSDEDEDKTNSALVEQTQTGAGSEELAVEDDAFGDAAMQDDLEREGGRESVNVQREDEMDDAEFDTF